METVERLSSGSDDIPFGLRGPTVMVERKRRVLETTVLEDESCLF